MPGFEKLAVDVLLVAVATVWVMGLTYAFWRLFDKYTVQPLRHRSTINGHLNHGRVPVVIRRGNLAHHNGRDIGVSSRRAR
jgi:hypothetical protein